MNLPGEVREGVFVVVAAYNEAGAIGDVLRELRAEYPNVVVVDDGSTDGTFDAAQATGAVVLRHVVNCGQGAALQTGIAFSLARGARFIVTFDADGQHRVEDIAAMVGPIASGECDITLGSRFLGTAIDMPWHRRIALKLAVGLTRVMSGVQLTDAHNGLRAFSRRAAEKLDIRMDRMAHASEIIDQTRDSGLAFREVPVQIRYTTYSLRKGQSVRGGLRILIQYILGEGYPVSPFQVVALIVLGCLTVLSLLALYKGWSGRREGAAWVVVWALAGLAVAWPDLTRRVAQKLGIGRGADLVMYCAVIAMLVGFFMVYSRLRRLRRDLTVLARHVAIREASGLGSPAERAIEGSKLGKPPL